MLFFTGCLHLGHSNIIRHVNRPFGSVTEMDDTIIANWNNVVGSEDSVFVLGDFTLGGYIEAKGYIARLNGRIHLIPGNHDWRWLSGTSSRGTGFYETGMYSATDHLVKLEDSLMTLRPKQLYVLAPKDVDIILCHYAMRSWHKKHYGSWHLFSHSHGQLASWGLSFDVGVDCWDFIPVSFRVVEEVMGRLREGEEVKERWQRI